MNNRERIRGKRESMSLLYCCGITWITFSCQVTSDRCFWWEKNPIPLTPSCPVINCLFFYFVNRFCYDFGEKKGFPIWNFIWMDMVKRGEVHLLNKEKPTSLDQNPVTHSTKPSQCVCFWWFTYSMWQELVLVSCH